MNLSYESSKVQPIEKLLLKSPCSQGYDLIPSRVSAPCLLSAVPIVLPQQFASDFSFHGNLRRIQQWHQALLSRLLFIAFHGGFEGCN